VYAHRLFDGSATRYRWAALFPEQVERAVVVCGSAQTSFHNQFFLRSLWRKDLIAILTGDCVDHSGYARRHPGVGFGA
jgi:homoserine acetyltransferase